MPNVEVEMYARGCTPTSPKVHTQSEEEEDGLCRGVQGGNGCH